MAFLTNTQVQEIKEHVIFGDEARLKSKYQSKNTDFDNMTIDLNQKDEFEEDGWEVITMLKRKVRVQRRKDIGRLFEDRVWCMFRELGFKILNNDENLVVQWGPNAGDHQQLDVVAVGDDAIFVVECKATDSSKAGHFKKDIDNIELYKDGVTKALRQLFGEEKKVKFIFATHNYRFSDDSEDLKRLRERNIYHFNENSFNYIKNLIKSYKESVIYQFYGLMFKGEVINSTPIRIPALQGSMGGHDYYMLSIEPSLLLKIGFVLHRTRVNDSMAPTYQRLLVPKRLKGITKFIDDGGYFPNSIIINFDETTKKQRVRFEKSDKSGDSSSKFGYLCIPNAYGIAYIIDGQHRVYGYAGSDYKDKNTIPVVAFTNMDSEEQLKIFMDINENQKAVSPSLRLDLAEDINWESDRADSRMLALRSSIIKVLARDSNSVLYTKISVGEDTAKLTFKPFEVALAKSGLLPKAQIKKFIGDQDVCLYDCNNLDHSKAMKDARKRIANLIRECYGYMKQNLEEDIYETFIESNRGTFAFVVLIGELNKYLIRSGKLSQNASTSAQMSAMSYALDVLCNYLANMPEEDSNDLKLIKGQGADSLWLHRFENAIYVEDPLFNPDGLTAWLETQNVDLQNEGKKLGGDIEKALNKKVLSKFKELHGDRWALNVTMRQVMLRCQQLQVEKEGEDAEFDNWMAYMQISDYIELIDKNWLVRKEDDESYVTFEEDFSIQVNDTDAFRSKKDKMKWLRDLNAMSTAWTSANGKKLNQAQVTELHIILESLQPED